VLKQLDFIQLTLPETRLHSFSTVRRLPLRLNASVVIAAILTCASLCAAQRHFDFDNMTKRPVKIPHGGLRPMHDYLAAHNFLPAACAINQSTDISSWFSGWRISVASRCQAYLLLPDNECLNGIDNDHFWIVLKTPRGYRLVLTGGSLFLSVLNTRTHGLHDLETSACTSALCFREIYKFDGSVYMKRICIEGELRDGRRPNWHRVRCRQ
jgi:hypothetical protein